MQKVKVTSGMTGTGLRLFEQIGDSVQKSVLTVAYPFDVNAEYYEGAPEILAECLVRNVMDGVHETAMEAGIELYTEVTKETLCVHMRILPMSSTHIVRGNAYSRLTDAIETNNALELIVTRLVCDVDITSRLFTQARNAYKSNGVSDTASYHMSQILHPRYSDGLTKDDIEEFMGMLKMPIISLTASTVVRDTFFREGLISWLRCVRDIRLGLDSFIDVENKKLKSPISTSGELDVYSYVDASEKTGTLHVLFIEEDKLASPETYIMNEIIQTAITSPNVTTSITSRLKSHGLLSTMSRGSVLARTNSYGISLNHFYGELKCTKAIRKQLPSIINAEMASITSPTRSSLTASIMEVADRMHEYATQGIPVDKLVRIDNFSSVLTNNGRKRATSIDTFVDKIISFNVTVPTFDEIEAKYCETIYKCIRLVVTE